MSNRELLVKEDLDVRKDLLRGLAGIHLEDSALLVVKVNDRHGLLLEGDETLADALDVVIDAAAGLSTLHEALQHDLLGAVHEQNEAGVHDLRRHLGLPAAVVVVVARETVDKEARLVSLVEVLEDSSLQQSDGDLCRNDLALLDQLGDHLAVGTAALDFTAKKIASAQMDEAVVLHNVGTLRPLAAAGTTKHKHNIGLVTRGSHCLIKPTKTEKQRSKKTKTK